MTGEYVKEHNYDDPECTCNWFEDSFNDKMACPANPQPELSHELQIDTKIGFGGAAYLLVGGEFYFGFDVAVIDKEIGSACASLEKIWGE